MHMCVFFGVHTSFIRLNGELRNLSCQFTVLDDNIALCLKWSSYIHGGEIYCCISTGTGLGVSSSGVKTKNKQDLRLQTRVQLDHSATVPFLLHLMRFEVPAFLT